MKIRYATSLSLLLPLALAAQQKIRPALPEHVMDKHQGLPTAVKGHTGAPKGVTYYNETFDSGLGAWTVNTVSGVAWAWTNTGPGPTSSTYPVPPLNTSTPSGWAILDDDYLGQGLTTEAWLISPVIDLSSAPTGLKVEFDQYMQEFQAEHLFVGVSTDGGNNWDEVEISEGVGRDGRPNPELMDLDISAWVANDPTNVQLRFKYVAAWDYGWQLDNIVIKDLPQNDMAILNAFKTSFNFDGTGLENIDYSIYPVSQLRPMLLHAKVKNKGFLPQTGVNLKVDVITSLPEFNGTSSTIDMAPTQIDSLAIEGFTPTNTPGTWTVEFGLEQNEIDEVLSNNTTTQTFEVASCIWAQDDGELQSTLTQGVDFVGAQMEVGNYFDVVNDDEIHGIHVVLDESTTPGTLIYGILYDIDLNLLAQTDDYEVQPYDLTPNGGASWLALPFSSPYTLATGDAYCVMVGMYGGSDNVAFGASGVSVPQVSIVRYPNTDDNFYTTRTPMVRAILDASCVVGINEPTNDLLTRTWPNPFSESFELAFELENASTVTVELRDLSGRLVRTQKFGKLAAGQQQQRFEVADLAHGMYTWTLRADGLTSTGTITRH